MITKQQIEKEAAAYTNENAGSGFEFQAFVTGAEWAAEKMNIRVDALADEKDTHRKKIEELQAENTKLREVIRKIIDTYDICDVLLPADRNLIKDAKKALKQ